MSQTDTCPAPTLGPSSCPSPFLCASASSLPPGQPYHWVALAREADVEHGEAEGVCQQQVALEGCQAHPGRGRGSSSLRGKGEREWPRPDNLQCVAGRGRSKGWGQEGRAGPKGSSRGAREGEA